MKRLIYLLLFGMIFVAGCDNTSSSNNVVRLKNNSDTNAQVNASKKASETSLSTNISDKEMSIVEKAQKDYQDSYNEYVRCLRESGPQTIETLQALTIYQKNYQIYLMILKAESQK